MEEKELFQDYELKSWELSPRIYKILGMAAALHLFGFIVLGQFNLLGAKACDSPYVGKVCQVLDAAYVSSILLGTDTEFSSRDYDKTDIDEADVTWVDVSDQFTYPAGYFSQSNPEPAFDPSMMSVDPTTGFPSSSSMNIPGITSSPSTLDLNSPAIIPTPNPNAVQGSTPESPFIIGGGNNPTVSQKFPRPARTQKFPSTRTLRNNSPSKLPNLDPTNPNTTADKDKKPNANTTANKENKTPTETPNKEEDKLFNKKPLEDFGAKYGEAILKNEVDINAPFTIEVIAKLDENGKLVKPRMITTADSDPKMTLVAKEAILAFGDSQLLRTLYDVGARNVRIVFAQNQDNLQAIIKAETKSENEAKTLQSGLNFALKNLYKPAEGSNEKILLDKAQLGVEGKNFVINFLIPNEEKSPMIKKELEKLQEKLKNQKPNSGVAETVNKDVNSAK
jgi:hypothetical protein